VGPRKPVLEAGPDPPKEIFDRASACLFYRIGTPKVDVRQRCGLFFKLLRALLVIVLISCVI